MAFKGIKLFFKEIPNKLNPLKLYPDLKSSFYNDLCFTNYNRLRYWIYFLVLFISSQLYIDLDHQSVYSPRQAELFFKIDILIAVITVIMLIITHVKKPIDTDHTNLLHRLVIWSYLLLHMCFTAVISAVESETAAGLPTYMIAVFALVIVFYIRGIYFSLLLIISLIVLFLSLSLLNIDNSTVFSKYYTVFFMVIIAWISSRIILINRMRTFITSKEIEKVNRTLDQKVRDRTRELSILNQKLVTEIKEREKNERALQIAVEQAEEADKLKSVFLANISHEIRTPLNGILGFSDLLNSSGLPEDRRKRYVEIIINSGNQLLRIIDDIMDISLIESKQLQINTREFSINGKMREIYDYFCSYKKATGKDHIEFYLYEYLKDGDDVIISDPLRFQQIMNNLLKNAFKFTFEGKIEFGYELSDNELSFFVSDTGIGIEKDKLKIVFERFRQGEESLKRTFGGTGLGLSISKGLVEHLGGNMWIDTSFANGSKFYFTIPYRLK